MRDVITTQYYKISPKRYVRSRIYAWCSRWWWAVSLPIIVLLAMGMSDIRYIIGALALVMVVYPAVMAHVYIHYALSPTSAMAVVSHRIAITDTSVRIEYQPIDDDRHAPKHREIALADITRVEDTGSALLLHLKDDEYGYIEIPAEAFDPGDMAMALNLFSRKDCISDKSLAR